MKRIITALLFLAFLGYAYSFEALEPGAGQQPEAPNLEGVWEIHGTDADSKGYSGLAIIKKSRDNFVIQYTTSINLNVVGIASIEGDKFITSWAKAPLIGLSIYKISRDGKTLAGKWMASSNMKYNNETLTYLRAWPEPKVDAETSSKLDQ